MGAGGQQQRRGVGHRTDVGPAHPVGRVLPCAVAAARHQGDATAGAVDIAVVQAGQQGAHGGRLGAHVFRGSRPHVGSTGKRRCIVHRTDRYQRGDQVGVGAGTVGDSEGDQPGVVCTAEGRIVRGGREADRAQSGLQRHRVAGTSDDQGAGRAVVGRGEAVLGDKVQHIAAAHIGDDDRGPLEAAAIVHQRQAWAEDRVGAVFGETHHAVGRRQFRRVIHRHHAERDGGARAGAAVTISDGHTDVARRCIRIETVAVHIGQVAHQCLGGSGSGRGVEGNHQVVATGEGADDYATVRDVGTGQANLACPAALVANAQHILQRLPARGDGHAQLAAIEVRRVAVAHRGRTTRIDQRGAALLGVTRGLAIEPAQHRVDVGPLEVGQDELLQIHVGNRRGTVQVGDPYGEGADVVEPRAIDVDGQRSLRPLAGERLGDCDTPGDRTEIQPVMAAEALDHHAVQVELAEVDVIRGPGQLVVIVAVPVERGTRAVIDRVRRAGPGSPRGFAEGEAIHCVAAGIIGPVDVAQ